MKLLQEYTTVEGRYPMSRNGRILILNMNKDKNGQTRLGSKYDISKIRETFSAFSVFTIEVYQDFTIKDINGDSDIFAEFIKRIIKEEVDALFIFVMAHGGPKSVLRVYDGKISFRKDILRRFSRESNPSLSQIPKCFVVNACRGEEELQSSWGSECDNIPEMLTYHSYDNTLILYSTLEGFVSYTDPESGSLLIQNLCTAITESSHIHHLLEIFSEVSLELRDKVDQLTEVKLKGSFKKFCLNQNAYDRHELISPKPSASLVPYQLESTRIGQHIKIQALQPRQNINFKYNNISLYARLLYKIQVETATGKPTCYKFLFSDSSKDDYSEIEGVAFKTIGMILYSKLQVGRCVEIKEASVDFKNWEYRTFGLAENPLQLTFRNGYGVDLVAELADLPKYPLMNLTPLREVEHKFHRDIIDLLGTITYSSDDFEETPKGGKYRMSILKDISDDTETPLTIWGNRPMLVKGSLVFIRGVQVIKPTEIREWDDELMSDYEIRTAHNSISQQSVILEITEKDQVAVEYRNITEQYLMNIKQENDGGPKPKIRKTE